MWADSSLGESGRGSPPNSVSKEKRETPWLVHGVEQLSPLLPQSQRLSPLPRLLTISISQEVGDRAEGPRGQVPGQLLQLTQQAFDFRLQVLHRLLHCLERGEAEDSRVSERQE